MSANDPNQTTDQSVGKPGRDPAATTDLSLRGTSVDPNATGAHIPRSFGSTARAEGAQFGSIVPAIPDYEIEGELGRGGMGVVYRARQTTLNRPVAIKMILGGMYTDPLAQARFLIEAEVIAALQHPNIVQLFQFGRNDGQPFFVLEFVVGGSLAGRLKAAGPFSPREAATMVAKLAEGMAAAHQKGVVHRDLKPANVLLTEAGEPKITDFGLARIGQSDMTATGSVMGTPSYMSPEQAEGKTREVGTLTDIYALGAILYDLTTGRPPFRDETAMATIQQVLTREPERLRAVDAAIPRDLETICLKCLEKDAKKRYATALELAADLLAFLEGRPITARPVGSMERTWKWAKRNPAWTAGIAAGVLVLAVATVTGIAIRDATHAAGLVQRLLDADTAQVPGVVVEISDYRKWTDPLLQVEYDQAKVNSRRQLHASLALLPVDGTQVTYLYNRLLDAEPQEVPVIRDALAPHKDAVQDKLWAVMEKPEKGKEPQRLRAAAALAKYDPECEHWDKAGALVVNDLVLQNPVYLGQWSEALRPVKKSLLVPLADIFRDRNSERASERTLATNLLADYAADQPPVLADLLMDADPKQFAVIYPKLKERSEQGWPILAGEIDKKLPAELPSSDRRRDKLAKRQVNAAVALLRMNQPAKVWPLLQHSPDPRVRSYLIHRLSPLGADANAIVNQLAAEKDIAIRRALLLSLGEFDEKDFTPDDRKALLPKLQEMYRTASDPGLHAASEWLLRTWKQDAWLRQVNDEWAKDGEAREKKIAEINKQLASRLASVPGVPPHWYVNGQGQTMVVIPGPVKFVMGSPPTEVGRNVAEAQHRQQIDRTFALAAKPVTVEQYRKHNTQYGVGESEQPARTTDSPMINTNWFEAVAYCNWLSKQEGLPPSEWCYEPLETSPAMPALVGSSVGLLAGSQGALAATSGLIPGRTERTYLGGIKLARNYLQRSGYRLPTEAEMEYAIRAGALTARYYGETEELLPKYAWYFESSQERTWPVASLKPNDLGFFDVQGNAFTWCQESYKPYPQSKEPSQDTEDDLAIVGTRERVLRGGSFFNVATRVRSACRSYNVPTLRQVYIGFRPARSLLLGSFTALPSTPERIEK